VVTIAPAMGAASPVPSSPPRPLIPPIGPPPARANEGSYALSRTSDGGYRYRDMRFEARIAPDGHVTFEDVHVSGDIYVLGLPLLGKKGRSADDQRPSLATTLGRLLKGDRTRPFVREPFPFHRYHADPWLALPRDITERPPGPLFVTATGTFDLTDELMRMVGQDPYRYEKAKFLSATFEFRLKMAALHHRKMLQEAIRDLPARLDALWADPAYAEREKRGILCLLWSEVEVGNDHARTAALAIETWIGRRLPAGAPGAYSADETAACAAAAGRPFAPYAPPAME
jgi:hypothetical protein